MASVKSEPKVKISIENLCLSFGGVKALSEINLNINDHEILADRLNAEPAIFKGCSSSELGMIVGLAIVIWLPLSLLLAWLLGAITMGFGIAGVGVVATVVILATLFQRIKRGRPEGYYQQWLRIRLQTMGLYRTPWVLRSGSWDIGRTHYAPLPSRNR